VALTIVFSALGQTASADPLGLSVDLKTDKASYEKGQTILISGENVRDPENNLVVSGTAIIQLSHGTWRSAKSRALISNGAYNHNYYISFGNPPESGTATWTITVSATDAIGNVGTKTKNISVTTPPGKVYYAVAFTSPGPDSSKPRGDNVKISVRVTEGGIDVDKATVTSNTPTGENIVLENVAPGTYEKSYRIKWNDPTGDWSISVEGKKTVDNTFKAGGSWINVKIEPAKLGVNLLSPTRTRFEVEESVQVRVKVSYPITEDPVKNENVWVNTPTGEKLVLAHEENGIYSASHTLGSQDIGAWSMMVQAVDAYGNSGFSASVISVTPIEVPGFLARYWWAIPSAVLAVAFASVYIGRERMRVGKLRDIQREMKEIPRLKREAAIKYFKNGTISRSAYDKMIKEYDARMDELKKQGAALKVKMKKAKVKKKVKS